MTLPESEELPVEVELVESEELDDVEEDLDLCRLFLRLLSLSAENDHGFALLRVLLHAQNNPLPLIQINYFRTFPNLVLVFLSVVGTRAFATSAARAFVRHFNPVPLQLQIISVRARPGGGVVSYNLIGRHFGAPISRFFVIALVDWVFDPI